MSSQLDNPMSGFGFSEARELYAQMLGEESFRFAVQIEVWKPIQARARLSEEFLSQGRERPQYYES